jgi:hypothetical protein
MASKLLTCPETAHLEMVEYQPHPLGMLIDACTRFRSPCEVECPRTCAARLDRRARSCGEATSVEVPQTKMFLEVRSLLRTRAS